MTDVTKNINQRNGKKNVVESQIAHYIQMGTEKMHFI